jgi:rare lipoprotein A
MLCFAACAGGRYYLKGVEHPTKRLIVLPEKSKDPALRPYVVNGTRYYPLPDSDGFVQFGKGSWYGKKFHGRTTSSGERFDMHKKSAAHRTLPLGTYVKVLNLSNQNQTIVKINDRGPFVKGRIIDLSYASAKEIGLVGPGVAEVKVVALGKEVGELKSPQGIKPVVEINDLNMGEFTVQVAAFGSKDNALRLADRLKVIFDYVDVSISDDRNKGPLYRVRVSKSGTLTKAAEIEKKLEDMGFGEAFIVRL